MPKPYPEFPLTAHRNGQWCKKINGKLYYFGRVENWRAALERYHAEVDYLRLGKAPPGSGTGLREVLNLVLADKESAARTGEITQSYLAVCQAVARNLLRAAGAKSVVDMGQAAWGEARETLAARLAPTTLKLHIHVANSLIRHAFDMGYIDAIPKTGPVWSVPSAKVMREHLAKRDRVITPADFHGFLATSTPDLQACLWLGLNCAYGPHDMCQFSPAVVKDGVASLPRSKTGASRQAVLWPETIQAIEGHFPLDLKPARLSARLAKAMTPRTAYDLRHTFATTADQFADSRAVDVVMGHSDGSVRATYRHGVELERLRNLSEFVRGRFTQRECSANQEIP